MRAAYVSFAYAQIKDIYIYIYIYINQKQPSCQKRSAALEKAMVKKDVKSKVEVKKWL